MVFSCNRVGEGFAFAYFMCKARTRVFVPDGAINSSGV